MTLQWLPGFRSQAPESTPLKPPTAGPSKTSSAPTYNDPDIDSDGAVPISRRPPRSLMSLPPELHIQIANQLIYPDALSLKHSSRYFYHFVDTGIELKIEWLMSRRLLHLDCPNDTRCDLGSDLRFCRGSVP